MLTIGIVLTSLLKSVLIFAYIGVTIYLIYKIESELYNHSVHGKWFRMIYSITTGLMWPIILTAVGINKLIGGEED